MGHILPPEVHSYSFLNCIKKNPADGVVDDTFSTTSLFQFHETMHAVQYERVEIHWGAHGPPCSEAADSDLVFAVSWRQKFHNREGFHLWEVTTYPMEQERLHPGLQVFESRNKGRG